MKYDMMPVFEKALKELEDENVIKFNVSKDVVYNEMRSEKIEKYLKEEHKR